MRGLLLSTGERQIRHEPWRVAESKRLEATRNSIHLVSYDDIVSLDEKTIFYSCLPIPITEGSWL
jgi:hypothetical protein